ncbi:MAG: hypothetical protein ABEN55_05990, partial [Bradymonadaceae bacterium]
MLIPVRCLPTTVASLGLLALGLLSACSWSQYPDRKAAVATPFEFAESDDRSSRGESDQLMLMPDGLWAFLSENPPDLAPGTLAVTAPEDQIGGARHLFVVVTRARWGLRLQRLDTRAIAPRDSGTDELRAVGDVDRLERVLGLTVETCIVRTSPSESKCLGESAPGTRWALYRIGGKGRLARQPSRGAMPVPRVGLVERGPAG